MSPAASPDDDAAIAARFTMRFEGGPSIECDLRLPMTGRRVVALVGPSGCGKTTILRCLAGLERPAEGSIRAGAATWFDADAGICLSPQKRDIGFLLQDYALFPHFSVEENIRYGLRRLSASERRERVRDVVTRFCLDGLEKRKPSEVSGGQQQRVALARALVRKPKLLLLDEPMSALDEPLRASVRRELRQIIASLDIPVVVVTHDDEDARIVSDHTITMRSSSPPGADPQWIAK